MTLQRASAVVVSGEVHIFICTEKGFVHVMEETPAPGLVELTCLLLIEFMPLGAVTRTLQFP
jgi:hypothetical protein